MYGRRYNNGLHQAIEAKENVKIADESKTLATITFQILWNVASLNCPRDVKRNSVIKVLSVKINSSNLSFTLEESEFNNDININNPVNNNENGNENEISYLSNNYQLNSSKIPQTPVVVIESSCTMSDHLKVRNKFIIN